MMRWSFLSKFLGILFLWAFSSSAYASVISVQPSANTALFGRPCTQKSSLVGSVGPCPLCPQKRTFASALACPLSAISGHCPDDILHLDSGQRLKFDGRRECRDVTFEPIFCVELLIVTKIENHGSVHQHRVVNEMRAYAKNTALEWTKLGT